MIRGKKNFLPPSSLIMSFGFLFRLEDSSISLSLNKQKEEQRRAEEASLPIDGQQVSLTSSGQDSNTLGQSGNGDEAEDEIVIDDDPASSDDENDAADVSHVDTHTPMPQAEKKEEKEEEEEREEVKAFSWKDSAGILSASREREREGEGEGEGDESEEDADDKVHYCIPIKECI